MNRRALALGDQGIGRLPNAIVEKRVGVIQAEDQTRADGVPERRVDPASDSPWTRVIVPIWATLPKQASCCNASCVRAGRRSSFPATSSAPLSV